MRAVEIRYDAARKIVICRNSGFFTEDDIAYFERELPIAVAAARRDSPVVRALFDNLSAVVQRAEIAARLAATGTAIIRPGDRFATVVASSLVKMQAERLMPDGMKCFLTLDDAEAWLAD
jgi:hypothetical protein